MVLRITLAAALMVHLHPCLRRLARSRVTDGDDSGFDRVR